MALSDFSLQESFDWLWRALIAHALTFLFLVLSLVNFSIPFAGSIKPSLLLMVVFYWAVYRPTLMPPAFIFLLGVCYDLLSAQPYIGLSALILLGVQWIVRDQRLYMMAQPFVVVWLVFFLTVAAASIIEWLVHALLSFSIPAIIPVLTSFVLSVVIFPIIALILNLVHRLLPVGYRKL